MNESDRKREAEIAGRARRLFEDSVAGLDGQTRSRLSRARATAIEAASGRRRSWLPASQLVPLGGIAAAVLAVAVFWNEPGAPVEPVESTALNDLDILLEGEELDLFEDLEFYAWLLEEAELPEIEDGPDGSG